MFSLFGKTYPEYESLSPLFKKKKKKEEEEEEFIRLFSYLGIDLPYLRSVRMHFISWPVVVLVR